MTLTQERLRELIHYDPTTGIFTWKQARGRRAAGAPAGCPDQDGYIRMGIDGKYYYAHRLAWLYAYGVWPLGQIDHENEVKDDNRLDNLRAATHGQNKSNVSRPQRNNTTGFLGVSFDKHGQKYRAIIYVNGSKKNLGGFDTPEQASEVYIAAKKKFHPFWVDNRAERE